MRNVVAALGREGFCQPEIDLTFCHIVQLAEAIDIVVGNSLLS